ncbi:MAG: hypothetical protein PWP07_1756, partial [Epulopiscium sp.]|nr:hypothetical protein [Candidatus Epulonipiscium sp.]
KKDDFFKFLKKNKSNETTKDFLVTWLKEEIMKENKDFQSTLKVWTITCISVCLIGIIAVIKYYQGSPLEFHTLVSGSRSSAVFVGTFTDPNLAAVYLTISFYIVLMWIRTDIKKYERYIGMLTLILIPLCLLLTVSRGGIIGFGCSIFVYTILNFNSINKKVLVIIPLIGILIFAWIDIDSTYLNGSLLARFTEKMEQVSEQTGEFTTRKNLAISALKMGKDHFITGVGRGNYPLNSARYLNELGIDDLSPYKTGESMKIPHNTLAGIFAELGIVGLLLYLGVFILLVIKVWKNRHLKEHEAFMYILIPLSIGVLVESLPLNIENFRGLWFLAGLFLVVEEKKAYEIIKNTVEAKESKKIIVTTLVLFLLMGVIYVDAARKTYVFNSIELSSNDIFEVAIPMDKFKEISRIYYDIQTDSSDIEYKSVSIQIVAIQQDDTEKVIQEYSYWKARGEGQVSIDPSNNTSQILFRAKPTGLEGTKVILNDIGYLKGDKKKSLVKDYFLCPNWLYEIFDKNDWLVDREVARTFNEELWGKQLNINIGDSIILKKVDYEETEDSKIKLNFVFKCVKPMNIDYILWLHGKPNNINLLSENRIQYGSANFDHLLTPGTSTWEVGKEYIHEYILPINQGMWDLNFGFWKEEGEHVYRLYVDNNEKRSGLYIGQVSFDRK